MRASLPCPRQSRCCCGLLCTVRNSAEFSGSQILAGHAVSVRPKYFACHPEAVETREESAFPRASRKSKFLAHGCGFGMRVISNYKYTISLVLSCPESK